MMRVLIDVVNIGIDKNVHVHSYVYKYSQADTYTDHTKTSIG